MHGGLGGDCGVIRRKANRTHDANCLSGEYGIMAHPNNCESSGRENGKTNWKLWLSKSIAAIVAIIVIVLVIVLVIIAVTVI